MHFNALLSQATLGHQSLLCVGLDPDPARFPAGMKGDSRRIFDFCARIVDATKDLVNAFKPQIAYFAAHRAEDQLEQLMAYMKRVAPGVPVILDAKRGDIGSTAEQYAREAFERYQADAVTLSPFMGFDSIEPYLSWDGRGLILLCRTSNPGGSDLQAQPLSPFVHVLTHREMRFTPRLIDWPAAELLPFLRLSGYEEARLFDLRQPLALGLSAWVTTLLGRLAAAAANGAVRHRNQLKES